MNQRPASPKVEVPSRGKDTGHDPNLDRPVLFVEAHDPSLFLLDFLEYFPAPKKSAVSTPTTSQSTQGGTTPGTQPDPIGDAQQKQIADLWSKAQQP